MRIISQIIIGDLADLIARKFIRTKKRSLIINILAGVTLGALGHLFINTIKKNS